MKIYPQFKVEEEAAVTVNLVDIRGDQQLVIKPTYFAHLLAQCQTLQFLSASRMSWTTYGAHY